MFQFGSTTAPDFLPDLDAQQWIAGRLAHLGAQLHDVGATRLPQLITPPARMPAHLDDLFDMLCALQAQVGQAELEFTLLEADPSSSRSPQLPEQFQLLGDPSGQLMHTAYGSGEYVLLYTPMLFKKAELMAANIARELGRMAIHQHGGHQQLDAKDMNADAELAAIRLGLGIWIANGSYIFENSCCGGGCGVNLKGMKAGLSMPEACFATALDASHKGISRRSVSKHMQPTQKAALKTSWKTIAKSPPKALEAPVSRDGDPQQAVVEALIDRLHS